ncbi:unnamed protein product [Rhodiola kirilowii]
MLARHIADNDRREHGKLPSKPDTNHRESVNAITLRGGKQLEMLPTQSTRPQAMNSAPVPTPSEEETSEKAEPQAENSAPTMEPPPIDRQSHSLSGSKLREEIKSSCSSLIKFVRFTLRCPSLMQSPRSPPMQNS